MDAAESRLAAAFVSSVARRLDSGTAFVRVPELSSPLPIRELLDQLSAREHIRAAVFSGSESDIESSMRVTTEVHVAIDWRNDASMGDNIVVVGDLERDRATGLAELPTFTADEVRTNLFERLVEELKPAEPPLRVVKLLLALAGLASITDLRACAAYCEAVAVAGGTLSDAARSELWQLGLFPDLQTAEIDLQHLRRNADLVARVRTMDATSLQRLVSHIADLGASEYEALRRFASTGRIELLQKLDYTAVAEALRTVSERKPKQEKLWDANSQTVTQAVQDKGFDEKDFLKQLQEFGDSSSADNSVRIADQTFEWQPARMDRVSELLADSGGGVDYASTAGSIEHVSQDERLVVPGRGEVEWKGLDKIAENIEKLEARSPGLPSCSGRLQEVIEARRQLTPFLSSIQNEGVSLFVASNTVRRAAETLIQSWVELWKGLTELRNALPEADRNYVLQVAEALSATDLRIVVQGADVTAYMLPLHPVVLEPRVRAARLFLQSPYLSPDFYDLVKHSLDPAMPSITVRLGDASIALGYAGTWNELPFYARKPHQVDTGDVPRALQQIIGRFISVHPYAELSLSIALVGPEPKVAKALFKWFGATASVQRARLDVYAGERTVDELRDALDEAAEELISGEVNAASERFTFGVTRLERLGDLPAAIDELEGAPHLLVLFDLADIDQGTMGASVIAPTVGSLVTEWDFSTNPLKDSRPVIRPRSGSDQLTKLVGEQAFLFGSAIPSQERSPLLSVESEGILAALADRATWVTICEGISSLVPPLRLGELDLLGRLPGASHVSFVYSRQTALLVEPILRYLQRSAWIHPDTNELIRFVLGTVRGAIPEGLLGFFKSQGSLSSEAVLGRLGFAAVLAYLDREESASRLIVSLDTEGARRWLGLRDGPELRADFLSIQFTDDSCEIEAVEVKARTEPLTWQEQPPESVVHAVEQVLEMERMLHQMFEIDPPDPFTPSRREILKRQVFLEALQQWEDVRVSDPQAYELRIHKLNELFDRKLIVRVSPRVFLVSPLGADQVPQKRTVGNTRITSLGVEWFKRALEQNGGASVEIPVSVLDDLVEMLSDPALLIGDGVVSDAGTDAEVGEQDAEEPEEPHAQVVSSGDVGPTEEHTPADEEQASEVKEMAKRLRDALVARKAPFKAIEDDAIVVGPSVVQVPFSVPAGLKLSVLESQEADIARDLGVESVRISNWQGRPGFAIAELPRPVRAFPNVTSLELPDDLGYVALALGAQPDFAPHWVTLDVLPHLLIGGTTGSGKSMLLRSLLWQLTKLYGADELDLVLIDAKGLADYFDFLNAPQFKASRDFHLGVPGALELLEEIVETRLPARSGLFNIYAKDALAREAPVHITNLRGLLADARVSGVEPPVRPLVVIIDEFAELILGGSDRKRFETLVTRFNQTARAVGGHLIAATQRPSTDVVTGVMKSNFARIALRVQQSVDSRVILDENGAEALLGRGDLLFKSLEAGLVRLQGYAAQGPYSFQ